MRSGPMLDALPAELLVRVLMHLDLETLSRCDQLSHLFHGPPSLVEQALQQLASKQDLLILKTLGSKPTNWTQALIFVAACRRRVNRQIVTSAARYIACIDWGRSRPTGPHRARRQTGARPTEKAGRITKRSSPHQDWNTQRRGRQHDGETLQAQSHGLDESTAAHKLDSVAQISAHAPSGDRRCKNRHLVAVHTNLAAERKSPGGRRFLHGSLQGQLCRLLKQERGPPHEPKQDKIEELEYKPLTYKLYITNV